MGVVAERSRFASVWDATEWVDLARGVRINAAALTAEARGILSPHLVDLIADLHRELQGPRLRLLENRSLRQRMFDAGELPDYLRPGEHPAAHGEWKVAPLPKDLLERRVEITGPISDRKMVINMLSRKADGTRADAAMLDFEDSMKPSWSNVMGGLTNLVGAVDGSLTFTKAGVNGTPDKVYAIDITDMPLLMVRVRGLHLNESNLQVDGSPVAAGLFDLVASAYYTASMLVEQGKTPKFYVPKVEHYEEARWWNRLFTRLEDEIGLAVGTLRTTLLIETLPASFQMEEILYEIRDHAAALNGGRWDKIFSDIKVLMNHDDRVLADRATISMDRSWMKNYVLHLIDVCHRHGALAMGGMAAFTPGRTAERREEQTQKVIADKQFEASIGHDGCWVSHPYFIGPAMAAFPETNQLHVIPDVNEHPPILPLPTGPRTIDGLRTNVRVGIAYIKGWNDNIGCVAWDDLMEDLATLEISRAQVRQWMHHGITLDDGPRVTGSFVRSIFREQARLIETELREAMSSGNVEAVERQIAAYRAAAVDAEAIFLDPNFRPFLTCDSPPAHLSEEDQRARLRGGGACE